MKTTGHNNTVMHSTGTDPGFFLGGPAPLRNGKTEFFIFLQNTSYI